MKWIIAVMTSLLSITANAQEKAMFAAAMTTLAIDWAQTRYIAKNPDQYFENNPILGKHPSVNKVDAYFAAAMIGTTAITYALPQKHRLLFLTGVTVIEVAATVHNVNIGIRLSF